MAENAMSLGAGEKVAYGLGDTACNFFFQAFNLFLLYYYTDIIGLSGAAVGTLFLVTRILDAVADPVMGLVADRTHSRWGQFRPYLLWGAVPFGLIGYAMFANPALGPTGKLIYAYIFYTAMMLAYTAVNIPYSALMGVMSPSSRDRTSLATYRFVCAFAGSLLVSACTLPLKDKLGQSSEAEGYRRTMALYAGISVVLLLVTFWFTRERVSARHSEGKFSLRNELKCLWDNHPWRVLFIAAIFSLASIAVRSGGVIYYFKYIVRSEEKTTSFLVVGAVAMIAGTMSTKLFLSLGERRSVLLWLSSSGVALMGIFYFIPATELSWMYVIHIVGSFLAGPTPALIWSMYADCADYGEWKFGRRSTGLIFSGSLFAIKVGLALGSGVAGWLLTLNGYVPNAVQTARAINGIRVLFSLVPAVLAGLNAFAIFYYPLRETDVERIEEELAGRKSVLGATAPFI